MRIALVAHDKKKDALIGFVKRYRSYFEHHQLFATGTTGLMVSAATGLEVARKKSGPLGGDQEIGSMIANEQLDLIIFFRDPLTAQPHEPDVSALLRLCDVYQIPLATNEKTAELFIEHIRSSK